jgi:predicted lipoprotein with Yx(FWY)xxD motif
MGALGFTFIAAGCGGAIPSSNGGPATIRLESSSDGRHLVDQQGHSLYLFEKDGPGDSYCSGACASVWPPLETSSQPAAGGGVDTGALATFTRDDGETQVSYHGHPLYYYAGDASSPGKTKGQEADQFGAEWYLVNAGGKPVESKSSKQAPMPSNSGSNGGGGGY